MRMPHRLWHSARSAWQKLWRKAPPKCGVRDCANRGSVWSRLRRRRAHILLHGVQYCVPECLEQALHAALLTAQATAPKKGGAHRIPLGLQLLSRKQVTESQLRQALAEQRAAGRGRIGDWLLEMGFVEGAPVHLVHEGFFGRDPIAVRLADRTVALRRREARAVMVRATP